MLILYKGQWGIRGMRVSGGKVSTRLLYNVQLPQLWEGCYVILLTSNLYNASMGMSTFDRLFHCMQYAYPLNPAHSPQQDANVVKSTRVI